MGNDNGEINLNIVKNGICVIPLVLQFYKKSDSSIGVHVSSSHASREETTGNGSLKHHKETDSRSNLSSGEKSSRNAGRHDSELIYRRSSSRDMSRRSKNEDKREKEPTENQHSSLKYKKMNVRNTNIEEQIEHRSSPRDLKSKLKKEEPRDMEITECQFSSHDSIVNSEHKSTFLKDHNDCRSNSGSMKRKLNDKESYERDLVDWKFGSNKSSCTSNRNRNRDSDIFKHLSALREMQMNSETRESRQCRSNFKDMKSNYSCLENDCQYSVSDSIRMVKNDKSREKELLIKQSNYKDTKMSDKVSASWERELFGCKFSTSDSTKKDKNENGRDKELLEHQPNSGDLKKKVRHSESYGKELLETKKSEKSIEYTKSEEMEILEILACFSALQDKDTMKSPENNTIHNKSYSKESIIKQKSIQKNLIDTKYNPTESNIKQRSLQDNHNQSPNCQSRSKDLFVSKSPKSLQRGEKINLSRRCLNDRSRIDDNQENELIRIHQSSSLDVESIVINNNDSDDTIIPMNIDRTNSSQEKFCVKKSAKQKILSHRSSSKEGNEETGIEESSGKERYPQQTNSRDSRRRSDFRKANCEDNKRPTSLHRKADKGYCRMRVSDPIPIWEKYGIRLEICSTKFFNYSDEACFTMASKSTLSSPPLKQSMVIRECFIKKPFNQSFEIRSMLLHLTLIHGQYFIGFTELILINAMTNYNNTSKPYFARNPNQKQFLENYRRVEENVPIRQRESIAGILDHPYAKADATEKDGTLLDKHDSFYFTTKSLLSLFQIMGIMPIMRVPKDEQSQFRTTFKWISTATFWAYLVWSLESIVVIMVGKDRLALFLRNSDKRFDEIIYNIIFLSILIPHFLLPVASWRHGPQVAIFKNMWTHYQLKYFRITGEPIVFPNLYVMTWGLCIFCWGFSAIIIISQYYLQPDFALWHTFAYYHIIAMLNGFCSLWYINCNAFGTASKGLARNLHKALQSDNPSKKLAEYRHLWVDLSHMMQQLGRAYSNMYGIYCLVIFFTTIISLYGSLSEILEHGLSYKEIGLFVLGGYCMGLLFIICNEAYHASMKVGLEFQERLLNVNLSVVDHSTQREVEMFLVAIAKNPPIMNLDGYTNINRELFTSNISFIATYLVVLMQFKLTLLRQTKKGNKITFTVGNITIPE